MNQHQLFCQLDGLNIQIGHAIEGLSAIADMVEACDKKDAPMPFQLAELLRVVVNSAANASNRIDETLLELKCSG